MDENLGKGLVRSNEGELEEGGGVGGGEMD